MLRTPLREPPSALAPNCPAPNSPPPRRRAPSILLLGIGLLAACSSPDPDPPPTPIVRAGTGSGGEVVSAVPLAEDSPLRGADEIRVENLRMVPPHIVGMVRQGSERFSEPGSLPEGYKRVPHDIFDAALQRLEERGLAERSRRMERYGTPDINREIRRVSVASADFALVFVVPVKPTEEVAERFKLMAAAVLDLYNRVDSLRYDPDANDPYHFEKRNIRLEREARRQDEGSP